MSRNLTLLRIQMAGILCASLLAVAPVLAGDWGINLYGLSYHWDRDVARQNDLDNEFNPGLGVRYSMGSWLKADAIIDAGAYYDSGRNTAVYAGAGLLWPLDKDKRFNLGAVLTAFHSDTYNRGDPFIAPLPLFSLRLDGVTLNLTHFPKIRNFNEVAATAMFITIPLH
ncbi:MAG: hypothetical protein Q8K52_02200 [Thiobacillus sp.]|nr:hypothetical protein [Thiobacillus sp.]